MPINQDQAIDPQAPEPDPQSASTLLPGEPSQISPLDNAPNDPVNGFTGDTIHLPNEAAVGGDQSVKYLASVGRDIASPQNQNLEWFKKQGLTQQTPDVPSTPAPAADPKSKDAWFKAMGLTNPEATPVPETPVPGPDGKVVEKAKAYGKAAAAGVTDAIQNTWNAFVDAGDWLDNHIRDMGIDPGSSAVSKTNFSYEMFPHSGNWDENLVRGVSSFVLPFATWSKALGAGQAVTQMGRFGLATVAGAGATITSVDPQGGNLSDLVQQVPWLANPLSSYLASNPNDSRAEATFKKVIEGAALGVLGEGLFLCARAILRRNYAASVNSGAGSEFDTGGADLIVNGSVPTPRKIIPNDFSPQNIINSALNEKELTQFTRDIIHPDDIIEAWKKIPELRFKYKNPPIFQDSDGVWHGDLSLEDYAKIHEYWNYRNNHEAAIAASPSFHKPQLQGPPPPNMAMLAPEGGDALTYNRPAAAGPGQVAKVLDQSAPTGERAVNIDLNKIDTSTDIPALLGRVGEAFPTEMEAARRGTVSDAQVALAGEQGMPVAELVTRTKGQALNAEQITQARVTLNLSAQNLVEKANAAVNGGLGERAAFMDALTAHRAIQQQVTGAIAESGRSLRSLRQIVGLPSEELRVKALQELDDLAGGRLVIEDMARKVSQLGNDLPNLNRAVRGEGFDKIKSAISNFWFNSLLSNIPRVTGIKAIADATNTVGRVIEDVGAATIGKLRGGEQGQVVSYGSAGAKIDGMAQGFMDSLRLGMKALRTNRPALDPLKFYNREFYEHLVSQDAEMAADASRNATLGDKFGNVMGAVVSLPSRPLTGTTEFFKALNRRAFMHSEAISQAERMGLSGDQFSQMVEHLKQNPTPEMTIGGNQYANETTLTKPLEGWTDAVSQPFQKLPWLRALVPFIKIKLNAIDYMLERSPFAPILDRVRGDIAAGGTQRDMAISRIGLGSSVMGLTGYMAAKGEITGAGPQNPQAKKLLMDTGWQPYSAKIGDSWYRYNRLEPLGGLLAIGADMGELYHQLKDNNAAAADTLAMNSAALMADHLTPEFIVDSFGSFIAAKHDPEREGKYFLTNYAKSFMPFSAGMAAITHWEDPTKRDVSVNPKTKGFMHQTFEMMANSWRSQIPWLSKDLPPMRNLYGEPIVAGPGYGADSISPVYVTKQKNQDAATNEMIRLGIASPVLKPDLPEDQKHLTISLPPRVISMGGMPYRLNPHEYDKFQQLAAGIGLDGFDQTLKEKLNEVVKGGFDELGAQSGSDEARKVYINSVISAYRKAAQSQFVNDSSIGGKDIKEEFMNMIEKRRQALGIQ